MELEEWIETVNLDQLETEFKENYANAEYTIDEQFLEEHEEDFADFVFAKYSEDNK